MTTLEFERWRRLFKLWFWPQNFRDPDPGGASTISTESSVKEQLAELDALAELVDGRKSTNSSEIFWLKED